MNDDEGIDFRKLEKELALAVEADAKYVRENDAKFRAVEQRVASYEEFRDIVSAAHLKPLERKDITGEKSRKQPWNPHAHSKSQTTSTNSNLPLLSVSKMPQTTHEFTKVWKRQCKTELEKYQLLLGIGGQGLRTIFKAEISMGHLGEFLVILHNCLDEKDTNKVFDILQQLSRTNRFDLSLKFLGEEEKVVASKLFKQLEANICGSESEDRESEGERKVNVELIQELGRTYGVTGRSD